MSISSHNMVEVEVEYTLPIPGGSGTVWGMIAPSWTPSCVTSSPAGMFNGIFEIVVHDMPKEQAMRYVDQLRDFYTGGWLKLIGQ